MSSISLKNVTKAYGSDVVIENLNLEIKDGSFTVLVGASGCGKTTTLRMITGLETVTAGDIYLDNERVNDIAPGKRNISMVFQNYALYPTMTVEEDIEFGLVNKKVPKEERKRRIREVCDIVGLTEYLNRKPANLSGGQRQRVALARAMVKEPRVFMMDEPLSNLDAKLRAAMRVELINMHKRMGTTFVYVTHDQIEAMSMADDIVLMDKGKIIQQSDPKKLYHDPNCVFTAQFIGTPQTNIIDNVLPDQMKLGIRPEKIKLLADNGAASAVIAGQIQTKEMLGSEIIYSINTKYGTLMCKSDVDVDDGSSLKLYVPYTNMYLFDKDGKRIPFDESARAVVQSCLGE